MLKGFKEFILRGNVVDLAVAVVIGAAFTAVVAALVADIITPIIAAIGGKPNFDNLTFTINNSEFKYGAFINALISFAIIAAVIYFIVVVPMTKIMARTTTDDEITQRECPECLSMIPINAHRCMYCTVEVPPVATTAAR
jgi:large conductance mechanosensitive channel